MWSTVAVIAIQSGARRYGIKSQDNTFSIYHCGRLTVTVPFAFSATNIPQMPMIVPPNVNKGTLIARAQGPYVNSAVECLKTKGWLWILKASRANSAVGCKSIVANNLQRLHESYNEGNYFLSFPFLTIVQPSHFC